jgi:hypothetical protein
MNPQLWLISGDMEEVVGDFWSASGMDLVYFRQVAFGPISGCNSMWAKLATEIQPD